MSMEKTVELLIPLRREMLPVAVGCAEQTAQAFGFGKQEQLSLSLAIEELFAFLVAQEVTQETFKVICRHGGYYLEAACFFSRRALPGKMLNMTARLSLEDENSLAEIGLLLAARTVDYLDIVMVKDGGMGIYLGVEKRYPEVTPEAFSQLPQKGYDVCAPGKEEIKQFARLVTHFYAGEAPAFCRFPGKLADMLDSGEYDAVVVRDEKGNIGGGFVWQSKGKMAEGYGPYVFAAQDGLNVLLVEGALARLARTGLLCMTIRQPTAQVPKGYFEPVGEYCFMAPDGTASCRTALYRQLEEDNGMAVFVHPLIEAFIRERYALLALPRQLRQAVYEGEGRLSHSAISTGVDRRQSSATLSVLIAGEDTEENLIRHTAALRNEGIKNILFELDLAKAEEVQLVPAILAAGFKPQLIIPWGGQGDTAVFLHMGGE